MSISNDSLKKILLEDEQSNSISSYKYECNVCFNEENIIEYKCKNCSYLLCKTCTTDLIKNKFINCVHCNYNDNGWIIDLNNNRIEDTEYYNTIQTLQNNISENQMTETIRRINQIFIENRINQLLIENRYNNHILSDGIYLNKKRKV